ncbi:class I SAM-dependent methyltransferase [Salinisphaera sp. LB1]|uniref:class I SAM-dependent methyltransferase n=1 Tax=Salinisphaera sp. LB1 TaxID=2183911 RepID=UPI0011AB4A37|nr:class I SAM-dependent methyltransferase [Salinisphaera sp. LB1]
MDIGMKRAIVLGRCVIYLGCGSGQILDDLAGDFEKLIGLDVSRRRVNELRGGKNGGWEFREADLNSTFPLDYGIAEPVIANQVIEHILDPVGSASEISRVLRSGGVRCHDAEYPMPEKSFPTSWFRATARARPAATPSPGLGMTAMCITLHTATCKKRSLKPALKLSEVQR